MCHSFETYDPKIAMREIEERLAAPSPRLAPLVAAAWARLCGGAAGVHGRLASASSPSTALKEARHG